MKRERISLRQAAAALGLQPIRLFRLGHHLRFAPGDRCLPRAVIHQAQAEADGEARYRAILNWLLANPSGGAR